MYIYGEEMPQRKGEIYEFNKKNAGGNGLRG